MRNSSQGKDENIREMQERYEDIIKRKDNEISDLEQQLEISKTKVILLFKPRFNPNSRPKTSNKISKQNEMKKSR